jgi:hypothetical protein
MRGKLCAVVTFGYCLPLNLSADQYRSSHGKPHVKALGAMSFFDPDRPRLHCGIPATGHRKVTVDADKSWQWRGFFA